MAVESQIFLNGNFISREEACLPVFDRGVLFSDSVYEVIPAYGGHLFRAREHLERLDRSLGEIHMDNPLSHEEWLNVLEKLAAQHANKDHHIYLQVTRGTMASRSHAIPDDIKQNYFAFSQAVSKRPVVKGIKVVTVEDIRWLRCDIKTTNLLPNILAYQKARDAGADEVIQLRGDSAIEGAASNLFIIQNDTLITPPRSNFLLPGITRDLVLELADKHDLPAEEKNISREMLFSADEVWLTSSTREVMPVLTLDDKQISREPGPVWHKMNAWFSAYKDKIRRTGSANE